MPDIPDEAAAGTAAVADPLGSALPQDRPLVLRSLTDPMAAAQFAAQRHSAAWSPCFDLFIPELAACALLLMVKDENDIIVQNLEHHYRLGFRRFFILDNASSDGTAELISGFRQSHGDALVFYAFDPIVGYYQKTKMNALQVFAQGYLAHEDPPLDWIFFVDADEFITCCAADQEQARRQFQTALSNTELKVMIFHWVGCASETPMMALDPGYRPEAVFTQRWHRMVATVPKIAFRGHHGLLTIQGNHGTELYPFALEQAAVMAEAGFYLLHYSVRSIEHLRKKIVNGGLAYRDTSGLDGLGEHWKTNYQSLQNDGEAALLQLLERTINRCQS